MIGSEDTNGAMTKCSNGVHVWMRPDDMDLDSLPPEWPRDQQICECGEMPFPREKALANPHGWEEE